MCSSVTCANCCVDAPTGQAQEYVWEQDNVCVCVFEHSSEDPEWIKADDTPGHVLLREPAVRSGIRDPRRLL